VHDCSTAEEGINLFRPNFNPDDEEESDDGEEEIKEVKEVKEEDVE